MPPDEQRPERKPSTAELVIEPLGDRTRAAGFSCANAELDAFLSTAEVERFDFERLGKTYLVFGGSALLGYFTISAAELRVEYLTPGDAWVGVTELRVDAVTAFKIGRLAVDSRFQGRGFGRAVMQRVVGMALMTGESIGIRILTLQAKPESVPFYLALGFHLTPATRRERRPKNRTRFLDLQRADAGAPA